jgi:transcription elongation factor Elf1
MEENMPPNQTNPIKPCPRCGNPKAEQVKFTWWGGVLGATMLSQVKCNKCGLEYNGKTGEYNRKAIFIYSMVVFGIVLVTILLQLIINR